MPTSLKYSYIEKIIDPQQAMNENPSILILGTSTDGPVNEPTFVDSVKSAMNRFGSGELIVGAHEALLGSNANVYLVRISGEDAKLTVYDLANQEVFKLNTIFAGEKYNRYYALIDETSFRIGYLNEDNTIQTEDIYLKSSYPTYQDLRNQINEDCIARKHYVFCEYADIVEGETSNLKTGSYVFSGGANETGISRKTRNEKLIKSYEILSDVPFGVTVVVPMKAYYDSTDDAFFIRDFDEWLQSRNDSGYGTIGVIGTLNKDFIHLVNTTQYQSKYCAVLSSDISIPRGEVPYFEVEDSAVDYTSYRTDGSILYGSAIITASVPFSLTNNTILAYENYIVYTPDQSIQLELRGITSLKKTVRRGWVIASAITTYLDSPYNNLQSIRVVSEISFMIRKKLDGYIGYPMPSLDTVGGIIKEIMEYMVTTQCIRGYDANISQQLDELQIGIDITPVGEITSIETNLRFTYPWR